MSFRVRAVAFRAPDLGLLPKSSPIYQAIPALQVRAKSTASILRSSDLNKKSTGNNIDDYDTSKNKVLSQVPIYTTGLSRLREHFTTSIQEDIMITSYRHHHKKKKQIPEGVKIELKGKRHLRPAPRPSSPTEIPELVKIDIHCMMKEAITSKYNLLSGIMAIQSITGETPEIIYAKKGVHNWKLRKGMPIGCRVTLKGDKMYQFLDKLVEVVLPKMKEWPGLPEGSGDGTGNIGMGFQPSALSLFPEIESNFDMYPRMTGFDITFNTTAYTNLDARLLMSGFNMPFQKSSTAARKEIAGSTKKLDVAESLEDRRTHNA
ncbi:ribosomal protein L5 domain-containing protein [Gamsiella multidivaricata]|uniref:ribosomal protein L5 domain-containing protein n=1 Tax=Gamsiella multidivaricata TaxID=101098 RepID=UPI00221E53DA|nr:ribosomal protein L5 domain-containing protein [Gamsiella multidivaricata]KAI7825289.1 ribosomal protein L5 domain-containing protein [Gamsiella multidivaricata]